MIVSRDSCGVLHVRQGRVHSVHDPELPFEPKVVSSRLLPRPRLFTHITLRFGPLFLVCL